jgi:hypothetical protein
MGNIVTAFAIVSAGFTYIMPAWYQRSRGWPYEVRFSSLLSAESDITWWSRLGFLSFFVLGEISNPNAPASLNLFFDYVIAQRTYEIDSGMRRLEKNM